MFKHLGLISALVTQTKLVVSLFLDQNIPISEKLIPAFFVLAGIIYLISPLDLIFDFLPFLGVADDFGVIIALLNIIPKLFKSEHTTRLKQAIRKN